LPPAISLIAADTSLIFLYVSAVADFLLLIITLPFSPTTHAISYFICFRFLFIFAQRRPPFFSFFAADYFYFSLSRRLLF